MRIVSLLRRLLGRVEELTPVVDHDGWPCEICGLWRPDVLISVVSRTVGPFTRNVRFCNDSEHCRRKAHERARVEAERYGALSSQGVDPVT